VGEVPLFTAGTTLYRRWGDWLPPVCAALAALAAAYAVARRLRRSRPAAKG